MSLALASAFCFLYYLGCFLELELNLLGCCLQFCFWWIEGLSAFWLPLLLRRLLCVFVCVCDRSFGRLVKVCGFERTLFLLF